jgi:hypothetical protein
MFSEKGLQNMFGENNCFLNVVIQALWHLRHFRDKFVAAESHKHVGDHPCVFCALKDIFVHFQFGEEDTVPPQVLRRALAALYDNEKRFQVGSLDDAAEAFDAVLQAIHNSVEGITKGEDRPCQPVCAAHKTFALSIIEHVRTRPFDLPNCCHVCCAYAYSICLLIDIDSFIARSATKSRSR